MFIILYLLCLAMNAFEFISFEVVGVAEICLFHVCRIQLVQPEIALDQNIFIFHLNIRTFWHLKVFKNSIKEILNKQFLNKGSHPKNIHF